MNGQEQLARAWTIRAAATPTGAGSETQVKIYAMNGQHEVVPLLSLVSWYPGAEAADIEAAGLGLAADRLESLAAALRSEAVERLRTG